MEKIRIGVAGSLGSFSEEAAREYVRENKISNYEILYLISVDNVLKMVTQGQADLGIFPIENSNGGLVYEAVNAMSKYIFDIQKYFEIDVRQCLMVYPGLNPGEIKAIASHDQALKQCKMYLRRKWPRVELVEWEDTAKAAEDLKKGKLSQNTAVIAPKRSAEIYGLDLLEENVQDLKFNFTTFLAVKKAGKQHKKCT